LASARSITPLSPPLVDCIEDTANFEIHDMPCTCILCLKLEGVGKREVVNISNLIQVHVRWESPILQINKLNWQLYMDNIKVWTPQLN